MLSKRAISISVLMVFFIFGPRFSVAFSQLASEDPVRLIDLSSSGYEHGVAVAFSPDGKQMVVGMSSGIALYNPQSLSREQFIETSTWSRSVVYSPDGRSIASGLFDGTARLWRVSDGELLQVFKGHNGWVRSVVFSRDGGFLITAADDDSVRVWNVIDGSLKLTVSNLTGVRAVAVSPDNRTLAVGLQDSNIQLLSLSDGSVIQTLAGHEDWVRSLAFSPDGRKLASGAFDATARLWDVDSGRLEYILSDHASSVLGLAFSPDGNTLATGSVDTTVKLWHVRDGGLIRTLIGHTDFVYGVAFSPDGRVLASSASDNTARLWDVSVPATGPVMQPPTSSDCRDCHHPPGLGAPPRVIQVSCETCHADGIGLNWCAFLPRSAKAVSEPLYFPPAGPVGIPVASENIAIHINYPTNGETLYTSGHNQSPVFVAGRVYSRGDPKDVEVRMEVWSDGKLTDELLTRPDQDGSFTFNFAINPKGSSIVAGAKAADPDCAPCHEDFRSDAYFLDGKVRFVITAILPNGEQAVDERWITVDTSGWATVDVHVVDRESGAAVPGLPVQAATILYEWRDRYASQVGDANGIARLSLEALAHSVTRYEVTVPPTVLNGYLYESVEPVILYLSPGAALHEPVTIHVNARTGRIVGRLTGANLTAPLDVWAINLPYGTPYKTSVANGEFVFEELPGGVYDVIIDPTVEQFGYDAAPHQVDLTQGARANVNLKLIQIPAFSFFGRVDDEGGAPLPFGWITTASNRTVQLDPFGGTFHMAGLDLADVTVVVDAPGYYSQAQAIDLSDGQNENLQFSLVPQPDIAILPWGNGSIVLPAETDYEAGEDVITVNGGWVWGNNEDEEGRILQVLGMRIALTHGTFALEYLPARGGWFYLMQGQAVIHTADNPDVRVSSGQMVAILDQYMPVPVPHEEAVFAALHPEAAPPLQNKWEPTLAAQIRDRLARLSISIVQVITFVTYILVLIAIAVLLIGVIYSLWERIRNHRNDRWR